MLLMWAGTSMPVIVAVFDVTVEPRATFVCALKLNGFGSVSQVRRVKRTLAGAAWPATSTSSLCSAQSFMPDGIEIRYSFDSNNEIDA